uniref:hypothetical protein n=1 Tax=Acetatifactor sp. TaxID=1872090 RepID=UPI00405682E9
MDVTNIVNKLYHDYEDIENQINGSIKYEFEYQNCITRIFYTKQNGLEHQIMLVITSEQVDYLTTVYFSPNDGTYELKRYIPNEIYLALYNAIFKNDNNATTPYFDRMFNTILAGPPTGCNYRNEIHGMNLYQYRNPNNNPDNPFFETVVRKNMSPNMQKKIKEKFEWNVAIKIIKYCTKSNLTLRFTSDIAKATDIFQRIPDLLD